MSIIHYISNNGNNGSHLLFQVEGVSKLREGLCEVVADVDCHCFPQEKISDHSQFVKTSFGPIILGTKLNEKI